MGPELQGDRCSSAEWEPWQKCCSSLTCLWAGAPPLPWEGAPPHLPAGSLGCWEADPDRPSSIHCLLHRCYTSPSSSLGCPSSSVVKNLPTMQELLETQAGSLGQEDPLKEGMVTHSSIPAGKIPGQRSLCPTVHRVAKSRTRLSMHSLPLTTPAVSFLSPDSQKGWK